jgi:hypothetical protein
MLPLMHRLDASVETPTPEAEPLTQLSNGHVTGLLTQDTRKKGRQEALMNVRLNLHSEQLIKRLSSRSELHLAEERHSFATCLL